MLSSIHTTTAGSGGSETGSSFATSFSLRCSRLMSIHHDHLDSRSAARGIGGGGGRGGGGGDNDIHDVCPAMDHNINHDQQHNINETNSMLFDPKTNNDIQPTAL